MLRPKENEKFLLIIGDLGHFFGMKTHHNIFIIISNILSINFQLIFYYKYKNGINHTYLKVFDMILGLISPKSIGLTNKEQIYKLMKESKILFSFNKWNVNILIFISLIAFLFKFLLFTINSMSIGPKS
jgi:hypothetical protein